MSWINFEKFKTVLEKIKSYVDGAITKSETASDAKFVKLEGTNYITSKNTFTSLTDKPFDFNAASGMQARTIVVTKSGEWIGPGMVLGYDDAFPNKPSIKLHLGGYSPSMRITAIDDGVAFYYTNYKDRYVRVFVNEPHNLLDYNAAVNVSFLNTVLTSKVDTSDEMTDTELNAILALF